MCLIISTFLLYSDQCHKEYSEACSKLAKLQSTGAEAAKVLYMIFKVAVWFSESFQCVVQRLTTLIGNFNVFLLCFFVLARTCSDTVSQHTQCLRTAA